MQRCGITACSPPPAHMLSVVESESTEKNRSSLLPAEVMIAADYLLEVVLVARSTPDFKLMRVPDCRPLLAGLPKLCWSREWHVRFQQRVPRRVFQYQVVVIQFHLHDLLPFRARLRRWVLEGGCVGGFCSPASAGMS